MATVMERRTEIEPEQGIVADGQAVQAWDGTDPWGRMLAQSAAERAAAGTQEASGANTEPTEPSTESTVPTPQAVAAEQAETQVLGRGQAVIWKAGMVRSRTRGMKSRDARSVINKGATAAYRLVGGEGKVPPAARREFRGLVRMRDEDFRDLEEQAHGRAVAARHAVIDLRRLPAVAPKPHAAENGARADVVATHTVAKPEAARDEQTAKPDAVKPAALGWDGVENPMEAIIRQHRARNGVAHADQAPVTTNEPEAVVTGKPEKVVPGAVVEEPAVHGEDSPAPAAAATPETPQPTRSLEDELGEAWKATMLANIASAKSDIDPARGHARLLGMREALGDEKADALGLPRPEADQPAEPAPAPEPEPAPAPVPAPSPEPGPAPAPAAPEVQPPRGLAAIRQRLLGNRVVSFVMGRGRYLDNIQNGMNGAAATRPAESPQALMESGNAALWQAVGTRAEFMQTVEKGNAAAWNAVAAQAGREQALDQLEASPALAEARNNLGVLHDQLVLAAAQRRARIFNFFRRREARELQELRAQYDDAVSEYLAQLVGEFKKTEASDEEALNLSWSAFWRERDAFATDMGSAESAVDREHTEGIYGNRFTAGARRVLRNLMGVRNGRDHILRRAAVLGEYNVDDFNAGRSLGNAEAAQTQEVVHGNRVRGAIHLGAYAALGAATALGIYEGNQVVHHAANGYHPVLGLAHGSPSPDQTSTGHQLIPNGVAHHGDHGNIGMDNLPSTPEVPAQPAPEHFTLAPGQYDWSKMAEVYGAAHATPNIVDAVHQAQAAGVDVHMINLDTGREITDGAGRFALRLGQSNWDQQANLDAITPFLPKVA